MGTDESNRPQPPERPPLPQAAKGSAMPSLVLSLLLVAAIALVIALLAK
jgi:hypothetical protein